MRGMLATLLCVGVQLIFTSRVQGSLPQPHIQFDPGYLINSGEPVTIQCSVPTIAENYLISKKEVSEDGEKTQTMNNRTLTIHQMTAQKAGLYICSYQRGHIWSLSSEPLPLVMSGAYEKPSLFAVRDNMLSPGQRVRLDCVSSVKFEMFYFSHESGVQTPQPANLTPGATGSQASLHVNLSISTQAGPYRCFGYFQNFSYVWSHPSDPLWLQLTDAPFTAPSTQSAWPTDPRDHPTFKRPGSVIDLSPGSHGYLGTKVSRGTTDPSMHFTIMGPGPVTVPVIPSDANTRTLHTQIPGASPGPSAESPNSLKQNWGVMIGVLTAFILLLIFFLLVLRHRRARKNTQKQAGAAYQPPDAQNLQEVTYSQVTCTVTAATKPTLQPEAKVTSEYATLALR